jgi:iron complex transport system ATP-binding protein
LACDAEGAALRVEGLCWGPAGGPEIVSGVSFAVEPGAFLAIVGANGAGKTSLLRCLYRAARPRAGRVLVDGRDAHAMEPQAFARVVSTVLQDAPGDFPFTVRDVAMIGRLPHRRGLAWREADHEAAEHALMHLDLTHLAERAFASLSGGEKQRALIARALAQDPRLIILDEPTNHLDIRHQLEILALLRRLGITVVATLHDVALAARFATSVLVLRRGRMVAHGAPEEALDARTLASAFSIAVRPAAPAELAARFSFDVPAP